MSSQLTLSYEDHKRLHEMYKEHDFSISSTHRIFQHVVPEITYDQTRRWLLKPLVKGLALESLDDWYFLGCLCSIKASLLKNFVRLPKHIDRDMLRYLHLKHADFCNNEQMYANTVSYDLLINLINQLTSQIVLELEEISPDLELNDNKFDYFVRGYIRASAKQFEDDKITIPQNTFFVEEFFEKHKPLIFTTHYSSFVLVSYSAKKIHKLISPLEISENN